MSRRTPKPPEWLSTEADLIASREEMQTAIRNAQLNFTGEPPGAPESAERMAEVAGKFYEMAFAVAKHYGAFRKGMPAPLDPCYRDTNAMTFLLVHLALGNFPAEVYDLLLEAPRRYAAP